MGEKPVRHQSHNQLANLNRNVSEFNQGKSEENYESFIAIDSRILDILPAQISVTDNINDRLVTITVLELKESASGSFGTVYEGFIENNFHVAIKKVLQNKKYKNRELEIMKKLNHNNITTLLYFFYSSPSNKNEIYLNLVMEFVPQTVSRILKFYSKGKSFMPMKYIKLYSYQMLRGLSYMHQLGICHRDIKPQNLLINPTQSLLRICDFGSAKLLLSTESNVSYICSRYYRAPELIFGATNYTVLIDVWSVGCVIAEMLLNKPIFPGETSLDQIVEIIKILGTPSKEEIEHMNDNYKSYNLPMVDPCVFFKLFSNPEITNDVLNLLMHTFEYSPLKRISALKALSHTCFDDLRNPNFKLDSKYSIPPLFDFSPVELNNLDEATINCLIPKNH